MRPASRACFHLLRPQYMPQQRAIDKNFKLHVPKTSSFGPVRRQRSPTQWRPWGRKNLQTRTKNLNMHSFQVPLRPTAAPARRPGTRAAKPLAPGARQAHHDTFKIALTRFRRVPPSEVSTAPPRDGALRRRNPTQCTAAGDASKDALHVASWLLGARLLCPGTSRLKDSQAVNQRT